MQSIPWSDSHKVFKAVVDGDVAQLNAFLAATGSRDINMRDENGMTPLHFAADRGFDDIVKLLLDHGADVNAVDNDDQIPLALATCCEHHDVIDTLLKYGSLQVNEGV